MSVDVVYSEVVFVKRNEVNSNDPDQCQLGDSSQDSQKSKPCGVCVRLIVMVLFTLTALLMGGLIALSLLYVSTENKLKDLQQIHFSLHENFTVFSAMLQDMHVRQQNLSRALNDNACPKEWEYHAGKCYYFSSNKLDWTQSRDMCISDGGHLVIINSRDEQEFLKSILKTKKDEFWIGLTDEKKESQWLWADNTELIIEYRYWIKNEPDNWKGPRGNDIKGEDCVVITPVSNQGLNGWSDRFCSGSFRRICETRSSRQT